MEVIKKESLQDFIERQKEMGKRIGFAPTMGALHRDIFLFMKKQEKKMTL
jgi:pantoate--beta-alanine ligase